MDWGHMTSRNLARAQSECGDKPLCVMFQSLLGVAAGAVTDVPYYAVKGVGYGLYYGGMGLGKGLLYTGKAIGRGLAYPFNRPPKPVVPPATWEQYKHDVLRYQKRLTKANKANKENQLWCAGHVPLAASAGRSEWESRCNAGDAISRAALPADIMSPPPAPAAVETVAASVIASPAVAAVTPAAETPAVAGMTPAVAPEAPLVKPEEPATAPLTPAPAAGDPVPAQPSTDTNAPPQPPIPETAPAPALAPQQVVQTGVAPTVAALNGAVPAAPAPMPASGSVYRPLPSATPANSLTPSEYGFEGRGGASVRYDQIWGKETPADEFIAKWNVVGPLTSARTAIKEFTVAKGTEYVKGNFFDKAVKAILEFAKRVRGSRGIIERVGSTRQGGTVLGSYTRGLTSNSVANLNNAILDPESAASSDTLEIENVRNDGLRREVERLWMRQVRDPLELKKLTLEQTKDKLWPTSPKFMPIRATTVCHFADPAGLGCSEFKIIYTPPHE